MVQLGNPLPYKYKGLSLEAQNPPHKPGEVLITSAGEGEAEIGRSLQAPGPASLPTCSAGQ